MAALAATSLSEVEDRVPRLVSPIRSDAHLRTQTLRLADEPDRKRTVVCRG